MCTISSLIYFLMLYLSSYLWFVFISAFSPPSLHLSLSSFFLSLSLCFLFSLYFLILPLQTSSYNVFHWGTARFINEKSFSGVRVYSAHTQCTVALYIYTDTPEMYSISPYTHQLHRESRRTTSAAAAAALWSKETT